MEYLKPHRAHFFRKISIWPYLGKKPKMPKNKFFSFFKKIFSLVFPGNGLEWKSYCYLFFSANLHILENSYSWQCIKRVRIQSYSGPHFPRIFPHTDEIYQWTLSVFVCCGQACPVFAKVLQINKLPISLERDEWLSWIFAYSS